MLKLRSLWRGRNFSISQILNSFTKEFLVRFLFQVQGHTGTADGGWQELEAELVTGGACLLRSAHPS